jgi:hypothetical protein
MLLVALSIAPLITHLLALPRPAVKALGASILALLLTLGLASGGANNRALTWWNKAVGSSNPYIAAYLNQVPNPVVILGESHTALGQAISLSYYLRPDTPLWLLPEKTLPPLATLEARRPPGTLFLFQPNPPLLETVPPGWQTAPTTDAVKFAPTDLVRLIPPQGS